jgi:hypothetical protein
MSINLHIERLILDGLFESHAEGPVIGTAMETELARLLADGGLKSDIQSGGAFPSVRVSTVQLPQAKAVPLGQQIARAVYHGIGPERSSTSSSE